MHYSKKTFALAVLAMLAITSVAPATVGQADASHNSANYWTYAQSMGTWRTWGNAHVEGDYVRLRSSNNQDAYVWRDYDVSRTSNEWIVVSAWTNVDSAQNGLTGRPYLYGYIFGDNGHIDAYMQGQQMMRSSNQANRWELVYGVFHRDQDQDKIRLFLNQGRYEGRTHTASYAAFLQPEVATYRTRQDAMNRVEWLKDRNVNRSFWNNGNNPYSGCWDWERSSDPRFEGYDCYHNAPELPIYAPSHRGQLVDNYRLVKLEDSPSIWMINHDTNTRHIFINEDIYKTWDSAWNEYAITYPSYLNAFEEGEPALPRGRYVQAEGDNSVWWSSGERLYEVWGTASPSQIMELPWWMGNLYNM